MTVAKATFSIVVDVCDQAGEITRNLPSLLSQQYDGDYEVIVVDESSTDETSDILKQQKLKCPKLYTTFLPKYLYQKNKRSLALLIGRKASKKEWIVFTDIRTENLHETWLEELSKVTSPSTALILGYVNKKNGDLKLLTYETLEQANSIIAKAEHWREGTGRCKWMRHLQPKTKYNFIAMRTACADDFLRLLGK